MMAVFAALSPAAAQEQSADELARELSNPTAAVAGMGSNIDFRTFKGTLPGAEDQSAWSYTFQPSIPFPQSNGYNILFRPAIPVLISQPVFRPGEGPTPKIDQFGNITSATSIGSFEGVAALGEIGFDLAYGTTTKSGLLYLGGMMGTLPTSTNDSIGKDQLALGPEIAIGVLRKWGVAGALVGHQWDVAGGKDDVETSSTVMQYFYAFSLGQGWQIAASPLVNYDHTATGGSQLTLPLGIGVGKTNRVGSTPLKWQVQFWKYVAQSDNFGPDWQLRFTVTPVIKVPWG